MRKFAVALAENDRHLVHIVNLLGIKQEDIVLLEQVRGTVGYKIFYYKDDGTKAQT
jgi:hypothetical protein